MQLPLHWNPADMIDGDPIIIDHDWRQVTLSEVNDALTRLVELEEVLKFYANLDNWDYGTVEAERGAKARSVLKQTSPVEPPPNESVRSIRSAQAEVNAWPEHMKIGMNNDSTRHRQQDADPAPTPDIRPQTLITAQAIATREGTSVDDVLQRGMMLLGLEAIRPSPIKKSYVCTGGIWCTCPRCRFAY